MTRSTRRGNVANVGTNPKLRQAGRAVVEALEGRRLLTSVLSSALNAPIDPSSAPEQLFVPGTSTFGLTTQPGLNVVNSQLFRFALDNPQSGQATMTFALNASSSNAVDTALALYDADGNLLRKIDADNPNPSSETLTANLDSGKPFVLRVLTANIAPLIPAPPARPVTLTVTTAPQLTNTPLKIDPSTGKLQFQANQGEDAFTSPADVDYYPIDFTNAGTSGTVTLKAASPDVRFFGALFRQDSPTGPWQQISSGSGASVTLNVTPGSQLDLTDANFMLAVSPQNFNAPAQAYEIDLSAGVLGPSSVAGQPLSGAVALLPSSPGTASVSQTFGATTLFPFRAVDDGPITITLQPTAVTPLLSIYDASGNNLLGVAASQKAGDLVTLTIPATKGQQFIARAGAASGAVSGQLILGVNQSYTSAPLSVTTALQNQSGLTIAPSTGGKFFRLSPPAGANYLVLQLAPDSGSTLQPEIVAVGTGLPADPRIASAPGQPVSTAIDLSQATGPVDVYLTSAGGTGTATLSFAGLNVPLEVPLTQFATQPLDVKSGGLTTTLPPPAFGQLAGVKFYELSPGQSQTLTAQSSAGAPPLLLRYVQDGTSLRLDDRALASTGRPTLSANLQGTLLYAAAVVGLDPNASGTVALQVSSPTIPRGVGVAMVPNTIPQPNQPPPTGPFLSQLKLRDQVIARPEQRDLFATILPFDITGSPTLTFTPETAGGALAVKLTVLDANNNTLNTFTTQPGVAFRSPALTTITPVNSAGKTVRILVEPLNAQSIGDGLYNLELDVATSDPNPFLATETSLTAAMLPPAQTLFFFPTSAINTFTSSQPTIQLYRLLLPIGNGAFRIWTEDLDGTVNTDIKIYRARHASNGTLTELDEFDNEPAPSFDYIPGDRSTIDAQVTVNNYHILDNEFTGPFAAEGRVVYIVVKNEQGSQGRYRINVDGIAEPLVGPGTLDNSPASTEPLIIDPESGTGGLGPVFSTDQIQIDTPHGLTGPPTLTATTFTAGDTVTIKVTDLSGNVVVSTSGKVDGNNRFSVVLPLAASTGYRLSVSTASGNGANLGISASVSTSSAPNKPSGLDQLSDIGTPIKPNPNEPYTRAQPAPDGSFTISNHSLLPGFIPFTQAKVAFFVPASGTAHFSARLVNLNSASVALYREGFDGGEFPQIGGGLFDFVSQPGPDGTFSFDDSVSPGLYVLKVVAMVPFFGPQSTLDITATTPAFDAQHITLDPSTAQNDQTNLQTVDEVPANNLFGTEFYRVEAPGGVQGPLTLDLHNVLNANDGQADVAVYKKTATGFALVGSSVLNLDSIPPAMSVTLQTSDAPSPGDQYFVGINRDREGVGLTLGPGFSIPQSGNPDLAVQPIVLSPDNGRTRTEITIRNLGFGSASATHGLLTFSNFPSPSTLDFSGVGPFGTISYITDWDPNDPSNSVSFIADSDHQLQETNENNNTATVLLSSVDAHIPQESFVLKDPSLNGEGTTWGRFVSGVSGVTNDILLTAKDPDSDIYQATISGPVFAQFTASGGSFPAQQVVDLPLDFGQLLPTSASNPNQIHFNVIDAYGLRSTDQVQNVDVVAKPGFLTSVTFDLKAKQYKLDFVHDVINEQGSVSDILGFDVPVVGDKQNQFLVHVEAHGTASLDPTKAVSLPLTGRILLEALDDSLYDQSFDGSTKPTDHLTFTTRLDVDRHSLDVTAASASLQLQNLSLLHVQTPAIKLFSFGLPDIASIDASVKFGLDANLSAGVKLGIDPNVLINPLSVPDRFGVMSPTYIEPSITGSATVEGDVEVLGFDAASLQGTVSLKLDLTAGLDNNDPAKVFSFDDFIHHLAAKLDATITVHLEADVAIIGSVWSFDYKHDFPLFDTSTQGIITKDPGSTGGSGASSLQSILSNPLSIFTNNPQPLPDVPPPTIKHGGDAIGAYQIDPHPQIVIDPATGNALAIQGVNVSTTPGVTVGNLSFSQRKNNVFSAPTILPSGDVSNPSLALSHDNANTSAAVLVYEAMNASATPGTATFNQKLDATDIHYRYFNGSAFGAEQSITNDSLLDADPSVAFNSSGQGLVAWVHNTSSSPLGVDGTYSRDTQDIQAAIWDPATHAFSVPLAITTPDSVADFSPAAFVDAAGKTYVVWIRGSDDNNVLMFSTFAGGAWSAPAVLPITGLAPGGSFKNLSIGSDKLGRVNVVFSYRTVDSVTHQVSSALDDRATLPAVFGQPTGVEQITQGANFSALRTTNAPDGSLIAYWQNGDGVDNGVFYSELSRSAQNPSLPWTVPTTLTSTTDLTRSPSLAVDVNGDTDVLFDQGAPRGAGGGAGASAPASTSGPAGLILAPGVGGSDVAPLPELSFSNGLFFPNADKAAAGASVTGDATVLNSGSVAAQVTIKSFVGTPATGTLVDTRQITLGPGHTYDYAQLFTVAAGQQIYSVQVSSATGEAITTSDDLSTATLSGLPDITVASITPSVNPKPGQKITLTADVRNLSTAPIGAFDVTLESGDPHFPQFPVSVLQTVHVPSLTASQDLQLQFPLTAPSTAGNYVFTVLADSGNVIDEAVETNNAAQFQLSFTADPAIGTVTAVANDLSGSKNVTVTANVLNLGNVAVNNLPVDLEVSRDGGAFVNTDAQNVTVGPQGQSVITFQADGLAGDNVYRVVVDSSANAFDNNLSDNVGEADLVIGGAADLSVGSLSLSSPKPRQGSPVSVQGILSNGGIADASNVLVEVFATPAGGGATLAVGSVRVPSVPALGQVNLSVPIDTSQLLGSYTLLVRVNRLHEVLETTELNDSASLPANFGKAIAVNNVITGTAGIVNSITLRRDADGVDDDVWINVPVTGDPTQLAAVAQPITINSGGRTDTLALDSSAGNPDGVRLVLNGSFSSGPLVIAAAQNVTLGGTGNVLTITSLSLDPTGALDLGANTLQIAYGNGPDPDTAIGAGVLTGKTKTAGIFSSTAISSMVVGYLDNTITHTETIKATLFGDINLDGKVNNADFFQFNKSFGKLRGQAGFNPQFDFNNDGKVNNSDFFQFNKNFGMHV